MDVARNHIEIRVITVQIFMHCLDWGRYLFSFANQGWWEYGLQPNSNVNGLTFISLGTHRCLSTRHTALIASKIRRSCWRVADKQHQTKANSWKQRKTLCHRRHRSLSQVRHTARSMQLNIHCFRIFVEHLHIEFLESIPEATGFTWMPNAVSLEKLEHVTYEGVRSLYWFDMLKSISNVFVEPSRKSRNLFRQMIFLQLVLLFHITLGFVFFFRQW